MKPDMCKDSTLQIAIEYFALLREQSGCSGETVTVPSGTSARALYDHLRGRHGFSLPSERLSVAINHTLIPWDTPLRDGDTIVFIPPVGGG